MIYLFEEAGGADLAIRDERMAEAPALDASRLELERLSSATIAELQRDLAARREGLQRRRAHAQRLLHETRHDSSDGGRRYWIEATADLTQLVNRNRYAWITWEGLDPAGLQADVRDVFRKAESRSTLVPVGPTHWPMVTARLLRSVHKAYFTNLCTVAWVDPLTGESSELRFTGFGTTLRGARRSRGLDAP